MVIETILTNYFAVHVIYPFLLIFVLLFAILQKSKILGDGKQQIDAMVSLAIALIVVAFGWATDIIVGLMPYLAVAVVAVLVFLIIYGFVASGESGIEVPDWVKYAIGVLAAILVVVALIVVSGQWDNLMNFFRGENSLWGDVLMAVIILGVLAVVIFSGKKKNKD